MPGLCVLLDAFALAQQIQFNVFAIYFHCSVVFHNCPSFATYLSLFFLPASLSLSLSFDSFSVFHALPRTHLACCVFLAFHLNVMLVQIVMCPECVIFTAQNPFARHFMHFRIGEIIALPFCIP